MRCHCVRKAIVQSLLGDFSTLRDSIGQKPFREHNCEARRPVIYIDAEDFQWRSNPGINLERCFVGSSSKPLADAQPSPTDVSKEARGK